MKIRTSASASAKHLERVVAASCVVILYADTVFAQTLRITTSAKPAPAASSGISLVWVIIALVVGSVIAWMARGLLEGASPERPVEDADAMHSRGYGPKQEPTDRRTESIKVTRDRRRARRPTPSSSKAAATIYEPAERERIMAWIEKIIRDNKVDVSMHPVFGITSMPTPKPIKALRSVDDPMLKIAIRNASDEDQPDITLREDAIRVLATFRTVESVDTLSQVAIYDPCSDQRAMALTILGDFDHPSVFVPIILALGDPTLEIKAAASKALNRLTFCRSDEWFRLSQSEDEYMARQCARAVTSVGFAKQVLPRLVNAEGDSILEALGIVSLLVRAAETEDLVALLKAGSDKLVARALLHALQITGDISIMKTLVSLLENQEIASNIQPNVERLVESQPLNNNGTDPTSGVPVASNLCM